MCRNITLLSKGVTVMTNSVAVRGDGSVNFGRFCRHACLGLLDEFVLLLFAFPVEGGLCLSFRFQCRDNSLVLPACFGGQTTDGGELPVGLDFNLLESGGNDHALALVIRCWNTFKRLREISDNFNATSQVERAGHYKKLKYTMFQC